MCACRLSFLQSPYSLWTRFVWLACLQSHFWVKYHSLTVLASLLWKLIPGSRNFLQVFPELLKPKIQHNNGFRGKSRTLSFPKICVPTFTYILISADSWRHNLNLSGKHNFQLHSATVKQEDTHLQINIQQFLRRENCWGELTSLLCQVFQIHEHSMHLHLFRPLVSFISTV